MQRSGSYNPFYQWLTHLQMLLAESPYHISHPIGLKLHLKQPQTGTGSYVSSPLGLHYLKYVSYPLICSQSQTQRNRSLGS